MESCSVFEASQYAQFSNYQQIENDYMRLLSKGMKTQPAGGQSGKAFAVKQIQKLVADIDKSLDRGDQWNSRVESLEALVRQMALRVDELEGQIKRLGNIFSSDLPKDAKPVKKPAASEKPEPAPKEDEESDDDFDLFGDVDPDAEPCHIPVVDKPKKEVPVAKSMIILDVKPWDDETNMEEMEANVRKIAKDGLVWGSSKLVPVGYGIKKLQIACVVEDDKIDTDFLEENIKALEDYVQSVDIASFNKL